MSGPFLNRMTRPPLITISGRGRLVGSDKSIIGTAELANADRKLDYLADYALDGRSVTIRCVVGGIVVRSIETTCAGLRFERDKIIVPFTNASDVLDDPLLTETYGGTNEPPLGLDGGEDIKGKLKPLVAGDASNLTPTLVNSVRQIYQASLLEDCTVTAARTSAAAFTLDEADYLSLDDLVNGAAPAEGWFKRYRGYFRLGGNPMGEVTCDARTESALLGDVFALIAGMKGFTLDATDRAIANLAGDVRIFVDDSQSALSLLDYLADSYGGFWASIGNAAFLKPLTVPSTPVCTLTRSEVLDIDRAQTGMGENGLPYHTVVVHGDKVETVQKDTAEFADPDLRSRVANEYRSATWTDPAVKARHPLSRTFELHTALASVEQCQALADRLGPLMSVRRDRTTFTAQPAPAKLGKAAQLGASIRVVADQLYPDGRDFVVIAHGQSVNAGETKLKGLG